MPARFVGELTPGSGDIIDEHVSSAAAIAVTKIKHAYMPGTNFGFVIGGTPTTREEVVHVAASAGTIRGFHSMLNDSGTNTAIAFDLKKNGTTVLSAPISAVHGDGDRTVLDGTLSVTTFVADDVLSISMTVTSSTGAQGPYAWAAIAEDSAP